MKIIASGMDLIAALQYDNSLISSTLNEIRIALKNNTLNVSLSFDMSYSKTYQRILLVFEDVKSYNLSYEKGYSFYNVERYKLFHTESGYYLSLDPADEENIVNENDNDSIISCNLLAYSIDNI